MSIKNYAFVQATLNDTAASGTALAQAYGSNVQAGNLLVVATSWEAGGLTTVTITDSLDAGAWTEAARYYDVATGAAVAIHYKVAPSSGACTVTQTLGAARGNRGLFIHEYSGNRLTNVLVNAVVNGLTAANPTIGLNVPEAKCLVFGVITNTVGGSGIYAPGGSFTERLAGSPSTTSTQTQDAVQASPGQMDCAWTSVSDTHVMAAAVFAPGGTADEEWWW